MIIGVGIDLISVVRIQHLMDEFKESFIKKIFTTKEIEQANKIKTPDEDYSKLTSFYAKRFAAKEAFAKAIGLGIGRGVDFKDIEVENDEMGKPKINILNGKEIFLKEHFKCKNFNIHLSLSDEKSMANAIVIIDSI